MNTLAFVETTMVPLSCTLTDLHWCDMLLLLQNVISVIATVITSTSTTFVGVAKSIVVLNSKGTVSAFVTV